MKKGWTCGIIAVVLNLLLGIGVIALSSFVLAGATDSETQMIGLTGQFIGWFYVVLVVPNILFVLWASKYKAGSVFLIIAGVLSLMSGVGIVSAILNIVSATAFNNARKEAAMKAQAEANAAAQAEAHAAAMNALLDKMAQKTAEAVNGEQSETVAE